MAGMSPPTCWTFSPDSSPEILAGPQYNYAIGRGVNINDVPTREVFPYLPGEAGCTMGAGAACPEN
jgi:hypothetical protein